MVDINSSVTACELMFYSDASAKTTLEFGALFNNSWLAAQWELGFIKKHNPSIEYLEFLH